MSRVVATAAIAAQVLAAQSSPQFVRAVVSLNTSADLNSYPISMQPPGHFVVKNYRLRTLIEHAYNMRPAQLVGGPEWINNERYDIEAESATAASPEETWLMVRHLLADRFKLTLNVESRVQSAFALVMARPDRQPGDGLRPSTCTGRDSAPATPLGPNERQPLTCGRLQSRPGQLAGRWVTMADLAAGGLSPLMRRPIEDRTGLAGHFDFDVTWPTDATPAGPMALGIGPATLDALEKQLGVKLEERQITEDRYVIVSVEQPK
ncbi:MAG TPA: TIGR03435 family protein [Vicinamibacterales bacterium]|nr:TIGR03435 family protein [Vicinamibacterales bacterium]